MKKVLVTGAAGFVASHLCELLVSQGHQVVGLDDLSNGKIDNLSSIKKDRSFHLIMGDVCKFDTGEKFDWIFHLAAKADIVPSIERPLHYHHANVDGTIRMLELARKSDCKKFIYAASSSCYGVPQRFPTREDDPCAPQYPYALTKWVAEQYVLHWSKLYRVPASSLRLFNVYGPRHRTSGAYGAVFGTFLAQLANKKPITIVGDGTQKRDFTHVSDVCAAFLAAAESNIEGVMNVGSGGCYSINHLGDLLGATDRVYIPSRPGEPDQTFADTKKISFNLGWKPKVSFEEGVRGMRALIPRYKDAPLWTPEKIEVATKKWFEAFA